MAEFESGRSMHRLIERLEMLQKERTEIIRDIEALGEEAERAAEQLENEVSMLRKQTDALRTVLGTMRGKRM